MSKKVRVAIVVLAIVHLLWFKVHHIIIVIIVPMITKKVMKMTLTIIITIMTNSSSTRSNSSSSNDNTRLVDLILFPQALLLTILEESNPRI